MAWPKSSFILNSLRKPGVWVPLLFGVSVISILDVNIGFSAAPTEVAEVHNKEPISPLFLPKDLNLKKARLGFKLFKEKKLSGNNSLSCSSCHHLESSGADQIQFSRGIYGLVAQLNTPSVFNSGFNFRQFWNGRAASLSDQVSGPIHNPKEMGSNWELVLRKLLQDPSYIEKFAEIYPDGITPKNITESLVEFERSLVTEGSKFDRYLLGDKNSLTSQEMSGYRKFKAYGCISCHQGVNIGGNMFQTMGVMKNYFQISKAKETEADQGRFAETHVESDRHVFKVPSLRNVALTSPYFHDGSIPSLFDAISIMGEYQLGRTLPKKDILEMEAFLETLTGNLPKILEEVP